MNYTLLEKLIPKRKIYDPPDAPSRKLKQLYRDLAEARELLPSATGATRQKLEQQIKTYEKALEQ